MKPYIFTHMMTSVDGRIDCPMVGQLSTDEYYIALDRLGKCSKLSGRITAALECDSVERLDESAPGEAIGKEAFHVARPADEYTVVVDTNGRLRWKSPEADGHPLIVVTSEDVAASHLDSLTEKGISWISVGKKRIDLARAVEILNREFGVERLGVVGGGHICGGFAEAGLLDEVSVMVAPGIDGRSGETAMFDGVRREDCNPCRLRLESVEKFDSGVVWLRYSVMR